MKSQPQRITDAADRLLKAVELGEAWPSLQPVDAEVQDMDPSVTERGLEEECRAEGRADHDANKPFASCPYEKGTSSWTAWSDGWIDGRFDLAGSNLRRIPDPHVGETVDNLIQKVTQ